MERHKILHKDESTASAKLPKTRKIPNKIASFKFPMHSSPELSAKYNRRKVNIIDKSKLLHPNRNPQDAFFGTLKLW